jgi:hypothetical protein
MVEKLNKLTPETMAEVFPKGEAAEVIQVSRILDEVQRHKEGTGKMWIQLTQAGAMANLASGGRVGQMARTTLVLPWALSRLLTSKTGRKWLTTGLTAPTGSATATRTVAQASAWLAREAIHASQKDAYGDAWKDQAAPPPNPFGPIDTSKPPPPNPFSGKQ